jgi:hypothetical protein
VIDAGYRLKVVAIMAHVIFLMDGLQKFYALNKASLSDEHNQIDGVKIFLTAKASGQIGLWIYRGVKGVAQRAKKTKAALGYPTRDTQSFFDQLLNVDLIAQGIKLAGRKTAIGHVRLPDRVWVLS